MKARDVALLGREVASLSAALVFYADEANYPLTLPESDQPHAADAQRRRERNRCSRRQHLEPVADELSLRLVPV